MLFTDLPLWLVRVAALVFGLLWGSFLNVVIYRTPRGMSVVSPPSHCPACGAPVKPWLNVPVLSYVVLRGRAGCCGAKMSPRYPLVEAMGGGLSLAIVETILRDLGPGTTVGAAALVYLAYFVMALGLLAAAFIDLEHMYLPDTVTLGGIVLGIATAGIRGLGYASAAIGAIFGAAIVWLPFVLLYRLIRKRQGMGLGDVKLLGLAGAWFGWPGALVVLFGAALQGTPIALAVYFTKGNLDEPDAVKEQRAELERDAAAGDEEAKKELEEDPLAKEPEPGLSAARVPFGPFLIIVIFELLFFKEQIYDLIGLSFLLGD